MRILLFLHSFEAGGVERVALRLAGEWASRGEDVRVAMGRDSGPQHHHAPDNLTYDFARPSRLAASFESLWMVFHLMGAIRRHRPDVLFCAGSTYTVVAVLVRMLLGCGCPPIVCKLSNSLERRDLPLAARFFSGIWLRIQGIFIDRFIGMAEPMRAEIEQCLGVEADRIDIVPDPALKFSELPLFRADSPKLGEGRRFVSIGRLARQKNYKLLLQAFARIAGPDDRLVIVGDGADRPRLLDLSEELGIAERVSMPGHVQSVAEALASAHVFVMSSNYEGVPAAIIEALAAGIPIVTTDCSISMSSLLEGGAFGTLVPIRDADALATAMDRAPTREQIPVAAMRAKAALFTIERAAGPYLDAFKAEVRSAMRSSASSSPMWSRIRLEAGGADTVR